MTLASWLARIERLHPTEIEMGLQRVGDVARRMQLLPLPAAAIVVAGTNGKGSTVTLIDALARAAGLRTVRYSSPHLQSFNERVRCNGQVAPDAELVAAFEAVEAARADTSLTYFEFTTLAALWWFARQQPQLYILEVGLGGRLDAVNLVDADVAVLTSLGFDHTDWLGDTLEQIGMEKVGIARPGRPLLCAADNLPAIVAAHCQQQQIPLWRLGEKFGADAQLYWQDHDGQQCSVALPEQVPLGADNLACAVQALACLGYLAAGQIERVASQTQAPGRCQSIWHDGVEWVFDVGHNAEALARFARRLPPTAGRRHALVAMLADKPARAALQAFESLSLHWYLAGLSGHRGQSAEQLRAALASSDDQVDCFLSVAEAVDALKATLVEGDQVLVFGSFHTVAQAATALGVELES